MTTMKANRSASKAIEFRGGSLTATTALIRDANAMKLADAMHTQLGGMPDFFSGEPAVLDFAQLEDQPERIDWAGLTSLLRRYRLQPVAVTSLPPQYADSARKAGLAILDKIQKAPQQASAPAPAAAPAKIQPEAPVQQAGSPSLIVDRPLRSGQQVYARGGDLILLGGVSNGAEVIADGSIHCYGPLRGRAIAGAQGDMSARIITTSLGAELVSIAGVFRTFERGLPEEVAGKAADIRLTGNGETAQLNIAPLALA
ncbi:septum site-determining protein MinC [Niveibacterium terrae]|uniref:septum site-determining protein MinC n=1 Tax=Niveibacterium terrae TaxID=3373598 RepID=UPI003A93ACD9